MDEIKILHLGTRDSMCGIFFYSGKSEEAEKFTYEGLEKLEYRGYDSFGIASVNENGKVNLQKFIGKVSGQENKSKFTKNNANIALGHTRWATHGKVSIENAHPHLSYDGKVLLVHNGIFENFQEIKDILLKQKIKFKGATDSEVMANWIAHTMASKKVDFYTAAKECFQYARGSSAFIAINTINQDWVIYRNGSALHIGECVDGSLVAASDVSAIFAHTQNIYTLQDGEFINKENYTKCKFKKVESSIELVDKANYQHFTLKEIFDQTWSIEKAYKHTATFSDSEIQRLKKKQIIFTGCGTAFNVCLTAVYLLAEKGISARAIPANEFDNFKKILDKNVLLFAISQSGETADTMIACKLVKDAGGEVYSILNNIYSSIAVMSKKIFPIHAGVEIGVVSTKAFSGQVGVILKLFDYKIGDKEFEKFSTWLQDRKLITQVQQLAKKLKDSKDLYIIGKSTCTPVASEMALKIKEASYIHAESFAAGELKHGVISLIEKGTVTIACNGATEYDNDLENSAIQISSRGGYILGIGFENKSYYKYFVQIPNLEQVSFLAVSVVGQLLAYYFAISKNLDPDKPRNLAKSVTVK